MPNKAKLRDITYVGTARLQDRAKSSVEFSVIITKLNIIVSLRKSKDQKPK
jgi:hypothetical protein